MFRLGKAEVVELLSARRLDLTRLRRPTNRELAMRIDYTGAEQFIAYLAGQTTLPHVLAHPAYLAVRRHARRFSTEITEADVEKAVQGQPSPFYGAADLVQNLPRIQALLATIREHEADWMAMAEEALRQLLPDEDLGIPIFPILGYDMGIGLEGVVCLNCNWPAYWDDPLEFVFFVIHECLHVVYARRHRVPALSAVQSSAEWRTYFHLWTQNEGFAVYAPLHVREAWGRLADRDYRVLFDPPQLEQHRAAFVRTRARLLGAGPLARADYLEMCFGPQRLTYRVGCELIRRIEQAYGPATVREALALDGDDFMARFGGLLEA